MAKRYEIAEVVQAPGLTNPYLRAVAGRAVAINDLRGQALTIYSTEGGGGTIAQPLTTDANGRIEGWVEAPDYDIVVSAPNGYTQPVRRTPSGAADVKSYGARGDGVVDDQPAIQAACNAAGITRVRVAEDTYRMNDRLTIPAGIELDMDPGATLDFSGLAAGAQNQNNCITAAGSEDATVALTANALAGATAVSVAAGAEAGFAAGDFVRVGSNAFFTPSTVAGTLRYKIGEIARVASVAAGQINLAGGLAGGDYNTADGAVVSKLNLAANITLRGGRLIGAGTAHEMSGVKFDKCRRVRVLGTRFENFDYKGVDFADCVDAIADGISFDGGASSASSGWYGVAFSDATQDSKVVNSFLRRGRHAVTTDYASASGAARGIPRRCIADNNNCVEQTDTALDIHGAGEEIEITNNTVINPGNAGIGSRNPSALIEGNTVHGPAGVGILLRNQSDRPTRYIVSDNLVVNPGSYGIEYTNPGDAALAGTNAGQAVDAVKITGNVVTGSTAVLEGIYILSTAAFALSNVLVTDNVLRGRGIRFENAASSSCNDNHISGLANAASGGIRTLASTAISIKDNTVIANNGPGIRIQTTSADCTMQGNDVTGASTAVTLENTVNNCIITSNDLRGNTTPYNLGTGTGHYVKDNITGQTQTQTVNTDVDFTLLPLTSPETTLHTGTLTAARTISLSSTGAVEGQRFKLIRTGAGAFNLGFAGKNLVQNQWAEAVFLGGAWRLAAFGAL